MRMFLSAFLRSVFAYERWITAGDEINSPLALTGTKRIGFFRINRMTQNYGLVHKIK